MRIEAEAAHTLAKRSRGTPRIANALLSRVMDFALVANEEIISVGTVKTALERFGVDEEGLSREDREILTIIRDRHEGGPVGLDAVAAALNDERGNIEEVYEPYLVYRGYLERTKSGRRLSQMGRSHLASVEMEMGEGF